MSYKSYKVIEGAVKRTRSTFQMGTWIEYAYPYALPVKAAVLMSNGQVKRTRGIGRAIDLATRYASVQYGEGKIVSGFIAILDIEGNPTALSEHGIVMFCANPNGANAGRYPPGWYSDHHDDSERRAGSDA